METPLLQTKLYIPPTRPKLVSRPRLIERLNEGLHRKLTLISAPAGFGKTTLLSEWVHAGVGSAASQREYEVRGEHEPGDEMVPTPYSLLLTPSFAWLSLDENDNDPARFLTYCIAALGQADGIEATFGHGALGMLQSPQPPPTEAVLTSLINEIAAIPGKIVLVLDDYHLIDSSPVEASTFVEASTAIDDALTFLLEHLPPPEDGLHVVVATRDDPQLPLARLRARGQLTELRAADLRFTPSEAAEFLNRAKGLDLSAEDVAALETRTEGWIAGLQLAAISMQGRKDTAELIKSFTGSHRFVMDYLIEEVLDQQPESVQTFLLQTAILDRLTGSLCDAVRFGEAKSPSTSSGTAVRFGEAKSPTGSEGAATSAGTAVRFGTSETPHRSRGAATSAGTAVRFGEAESPTGHYSGQAILEMLEHANLFIVPLDEERRWYRYHHLFADLLRQRLHQNPPPLSSPPMRAPLGGTEGGIVAELHRRASEWYEQKGFVDEAIDHALRGEYFERAAYLIEDQFGNNYERGDQATLRRWLAEMPEEFVFSKPHLCILNAWILFTSGRLETADRSLQAAEKMLGPDTDQELIPSQDKDQLSDADRMKFVGRVAAIRSFLASYSGDMPTTIRYARQALESLPEHELEWRSAALIALGDAYASQGQMVAAHEVRSDALATSKASGDTYIVLIANLRLAEILRQQGKLQQVIDICERQLKRAKESGISESGLAGWLLGIWGEVLAELDHLDRALDKAKKGVELTARSGDMTYIGWSNVCLVRVLFSSGDIAGAEDVIQSMENTAREYDMSILAILQSSAWQARIWLAQGNLEAASQWVGERELDPDGEPTYLHEMEYIVFARILIAQGRLDEAVRLLRRLLEGAEAGGRNSRVIEILMLQALTFQARGDTDEAMHSLEGALTLAHAGGFIRIFVDEGPPMARLLYQTLSRAETLSPGIAPDYVRQLLAAFSSAEPEQTDSLKTQTSNSDLIEPLSERELEVLELIAEGLTNQEIATRLYISLNTVKVHTRNIYAKLGAHHRAGAVARARALGVLRST